MGIEHNPFSGIDTICRKCQDHSPCRGIPLQGGDHQMGFGGDEFPHQVIHGLNVAPGLLSRVIGGFDHVQVDTVLPEVRTAHQHNHFGWSLAYENESFSQTLTMVGAHGPIVKVKMEVPDGLSFLIPDVTVGPSIVRLVYS